MKVACLSHRRKQKYDFSESLYCPFKGNNIFSVSISHLSLGISGDWMQRLAPNPAWSRVQDEIILGVYCIRWLCSSKWKIDLNLCIYSSGRRNMGDDLSLFNSSDQNNRLKKKIEGMKRERKEFKIVDYWWSKWMERTLFIGT